MDTFTYLCTSCGRANNIKSRKNKAGKKANCLYCNKKRTFTLCRDVLHHSKLEGFCSEFTLNGDISIQNDYVHVDGIGVRGNVNVAHSSGGQLMTMRVSKHKGKEMTGNINIRNSNVGAVDSNITTGNINVDSSSVDTINRNMIGFSFDKDDAVLEAINYMLGKDLPDDIVDKLITLLDILENNPETANKLGQVLNDKNKKNKGLTGSVILKNLKKIGIGTLSKARDKGLDRLFDWFMAVLDNSSA